MHHRHLLVGSAVALFASVAFSAAPAAATPCTNLSGLQLQHTTITSATDNDSGTFVTPDDPADDAHRPSGLLPGHGDADPDERFHHQDRGLAAQDDVEQPLPRHRRRRLPGHHHLQRARPRHPAGFRRDQQRSRHRVIRMHAAVLRLGRQHRPTPVGTAFGYPPSPTIGLFGHPERIKDFGYRAIHLMTLRGKEIANAFYGQGAQTAYFAGCSTGGQNALMEAQRFPEDYNGILAGAAAFNRTHLHMAALSAWQNTHATPGRFIQPGQMTLINNAVLAQCAGHDGGLATDQFLTDPRDCKFDPKVLQCTGSNVPPACLTAEQVTTMQNVLCRHERSAERAAHQSRRRTRLRNRQRVCARPRIPGGPAGTAIRRPVLLGVRAELRGSLQRDQLRELRLPS